MFLTVRNSPQSCLLVSVLRVVGSALQVLVQILSFSAVLSCSWHSDF